MRSLGGGPGGYFTVALSGNETTELSAPQHNGMQLSLKGEPLALGSIKFPMRDSHKAAEGGVKEISLGDSAGIRLEDTEKRHSNSSVASVSDHN